MKTIDQHRVGRLLMRWSLSAAVAMAVLASYSPARADWNWPREVQVKDGTLTIYTPQIEAFRGDKVDGRAAIEMVPKDGKETTFGVFWFSARLATDRDSRTVSLEDIKVTGVKFPEKAGAQDTQAAEAILRQGGGLSSMSMSMDTFVAITAVLPREKVAPEKFNNAPPKIIVVKVPTALVIINGKPIMRDVPGTAVNRVVNTPFVMLYDKSAKAYYLKGGKWWYQATDIKGDWKTTDTPPEAIVQAALKVSEPEPPELKAFTQEEGSAAPAVIVATEPTELIVTDGDPQYAVIPGTDLLYVSNTGNDIFMDVNSKQFYVVLAGRWYRSPSLAGGKWNYVLSQKLPAAFYRIPPGSDKGYVLAFIADTKQADEAVMEAQIPQTSAIKRSEATADVAYDGSPEFKPIKDTGLEYAVNTGSQVIKVNGKYYLAQKAVWYVSDSPTGPWVVSDHTPPNIESIPPDSPVYNVKYVRVYDATPDVVHAGYTSGYVGSYVDNGTVVYGTGYDYPGWEGTGYYPAPLTWGLSPWYYPYYGEWGFGAGFVSGAFLGFVTGAIVSPWWGWGGWWGPWWGGWWGPWWGGWHGGPWSGGHWGGYWGWGWHAQQWRHGNYKGTWQHGWPSSNLYNRPGSTAWNTQAHRGPQAGPGGRASLMPTNMARASAQPTGSGTRYRNVMPGGTAGTRPGGGAAVRQNRPSGTMQGAQRYGAARQNNVFASPNGGVFRRTQQGWQQYNRGGWAQPQSGYSRNQSLLNRDYNARMRGIQRESSFGGYSRGGHSSGVSRGGGFSSSGRSGGMSGGGSHGGGVGHGGGGKR
ncbi:MAG TPA: hypothetical protein VMU21_03090 [Thermodesulfovibrionales bacterium]|nr:hypothetical protein [Thermodesulfovibrionales bacterium]